MDQRDATLTRLRRLIASDKLAAAGRLPPERLLASRLGVSRRALRQALAALEGEGRLSRRQGAGTFICERRPADAVLFQQAMQATGPIEVLEVRLTLEPTLARFAALRASRWDIEELTALAEATRIAATPLAYERADAAFHRRIALAARNALFLAVFDAVLAAIEQASWHGVRESAHCSKNKDINSRFHREVVDAIAERAPDRAAERMFTHLCRVRDHLLASTYPQAPGAAAERSEAA
jgi:GntR family transcriptional repressor for pyruvate dehydrogenase complex